MSTHDMRGTADVVEPRTLPRRLWLITFIVGALVWAAVAGVIALTDNTIFVPNLILLGTFLVPVCTVQFVLARPREAHLSVDTLVVGFMAGGIAGVVLTGTMEVYILPDVVGRNAFIGLIEEGGKALLLVAVASMVRPRVPRDGMVLGATVGAGFAAFESAGYALGAMLQYSDDHPLLNVLQTEAMRAVLAPFGHITWSAILGGAIFASAWGTDRFRLDRRVVGTFLGVVALHALWDASYGWAIGVARGLGGEGWSLAWPDTEAWVGTPSGSDLVRYEVVYDGMLAIVGTIGVVWAVRRWRAYQIDRWRADHPPSEPPRVAA